jgi:hypothetical protein
MPSIIQGNWPFDEDGNPLALISFTVEEKIGLPEYSNITVGPVTIHRFVHDTVADRKHGLKETASEVEQVLAEEREIIYEALRNQKAK